MMDISAVNALTYEEFVEIFGNVVEKCPLISAAVWSHRPFTGLSDIEAHICEFIDSLPESGKEGVLRCHPDLAGSALWSGTLTRDSQREQSGVGMNILEPEEVSHMRRMNAHYKEHFGFPFIICVRMHDKAGILRQLHERLENERAAERERALEEVKKICRLRLCDIVQSDYPNKL